MHEEAIELLKFDAVKIHLASAKTYEMLGEKERAEVSRGHARRLLEAAEELEKAGESRAHGA